MIRSLEHIDSLNITLSRMDENALNALYQRVFSSADAELVLQDLANRCYVYETTVQGTEPFNSHREGMRALYLSIQNRLLNAVAKKEEAEK